MTVGE